MKDEKKHSDIEKITTSDLKKKNTNGKKSYRKTLVRY